MKKRFVIRIGLILLLIFGLIVVCDRVIYYSAKHKLYDNTDSIPHRKIGLILGTSPISTWNGRRNHYFDHRINAASELYKAGKVDFGGLHLDNVQTSVVRNQKAPLLLGQTVLGRLGKIEIDNSNKKLVITKRLEKI